MRFCSLGSGSTGNAAVVEAGGGDGTRVLIDCGFTLKELALRLARADVAPEAIDAIFVTHEHGDHIGCAFALARRHRIALWTSRGTWRAAGEPALDAGLLHFARDGEPIAVGALELRPYTVPHDAAEPLQLVCGDGARRLGVLTDAGSVTPHATAALAGCEALLLECNHDRAMLAASAYPASLKARVSGRFGHLANDAAAEVLAACRHERLRHVVAAHLSLQNNRRELASGALAAVLGTRPDDIVVATHDEGFGWLDLR
ncbi:MAG TPA: MBL fold metallo-hydrolase [Methylibium sp.]|uniref:MBL fold metallo-hydrolase n=1 Tax=Methylibium sp. TaxID=2067992 RepID=UPI002DB7B9E8|nr:MBL fold metallo-hydrolase [Methylibium sp.]HEU4459390.1 MBL fold metallo-hydrolase [Methylibium sp.]